MYETHADITIRRLGSADAEALERLAQRDSAVVPDGPMLAAVTPGGALLAVISLHSREVIADPFLPSDAAVGLLRVRAAQLEGEHGHANGGRRFRRRRRARAAQAGSPPGAGGRLVALSDLRPPS